MKKRYKMVSKKYFGKIALSLGDCPSQVLFVLGLSLVCPRLVFHMSLLVFFVLQMSSFCPCLGLEMVDLNMSATSPL